MSEIVNNDAQNYIYYNMLEQLPNREARNAKFKNLPIINIE